MRLPLVLLLLAPAAAGAPLLSGVAPDLPGAGPGDEGVALWSPEPVDLSGWALSDGESSWPFPAGTRMAAESEAWFVGDPGKWSSLGGPSPTGTFDLTLGNDGDDVRLLDPSGTVVDAFAWGDGAAPGVDGAVSYTSPGLVYRRLAGGAGWRDTDAADDWRTPRTHRVGESSWSADWVTVDAVQPYACPDHCLRVWSDLLATASRRVVLHVYDLRAPWLADLLAEAAARAPTAVLVQETPVGMDDGERRLRDEALRRVEAAGGEAWLAQWGRYAYHHLKVLVVDDAVAVQSDNGVPSSFPESPTWGQRGWGLVVHDAAFAQRVTEVLAADRAAWDVVPFQPGPPAEVLRYPPGEGSHRPVPLPPPVRDARVRLVVTPEMTADPAADPVLGAVRGASSSVRVQQLDLRLDAGNPLGWGGDDGMHRALLDAAGRGVAVSVQAAPPFGDGDGNRPVLDALAAAGVPAAEFRGPLWLHNKGVVVDDRFVYVGSMNQNHHSRSNNREVGVLVDDPAVASWYSGLFDRDAAEARDWSAVASDLESLPPPPWPILFGVVLLVGLSRR